MLMPEWFGKLHNLEDRDYTANEISQIINRTEATVHRVLQRWGAVPDYTVFKNRMRAFYPAEQLKTLKRVSEIDAKRRKSKFPKK